MVRDAAGRRKPSTSVYRVVWATAALVVGFLGAYVSAVQQSSWIVGFGLAVILASSVAVGVRYPRWSWTRVPVEISRTVVVVAAGWSTIGLIALFGGFGALVGLLLTVSAPEVLAWLARTADGTLAQLAGGPTAKTDTPRPDVGRLSMVELCGRWCASHAELRRLQHTRQVALLAVLISARSSYLDELERRDPAGFDRWLSSEAGLASDPGDYIASHTPT